MRVLLNCLSAVGAKTGIGHYANELLRHLSAEVGPGVVASFPTGLLREAARGWSRVRPWVLRSGGQGATSPGSPGARARGSLRASLVQTLRQHGRALLQRSFRAACRRHGYQLYHEPNYIPLPSDIPIVATLPDLSVLLQPQWHPADRVAHFERHFRAGLARCSHFLAISEFSRREIIATLGLRPGQVTRTYLGIRRGLGPLPEGEVSEALRRLGLPPRYLLYVGTIEPRKNVLTLLRAYCALPPGVRGRYPLVLAGGWGWGARDVAEYLDGEARHRGVVHLGYVAEANLAALYNGARALVFPSFYEGFGLPPVEMLACGGAVLASSAGAVAETAGRGAHLVEPADLGGWRDALLRVATDDGWWAELRARAAAVGRPFTWERCALDTLAVYRALTGQGRAAA
jgi:alpha-1,3-rhamnosyl/mannosyltransferase